ncbi:GntP family permease [Streptomyces sp. M2CJ-2]|uniref:GntP family permease n=1 Tax=Streptomyces sp. M2CJ-2 TaxID=2803948 RepID=UPI0019291901|nr:SLC13 family permease [Streptomyces sp. M2CJ-2]MBL3669849.1 GntP family permease [Streptomyces sp. M2CJ-2]
MPDEALLFLNTTIAIVGIVVAITWLRFPSVFALLFGTLYLGLTTAVGAKGTPEALAAGFADVMGDIGILVTFGVVLGALLTVTNTMQRLVEAMLKIFGERSVPYVFAATLSSMLTSIYSDVLLVLSSPLARRLGPRLGPKGRALMGGSLTAGIEVGLVFVAPGVAAVAIAGILDVPLGQMFLIGLAVGLPTALLTTLVFAALLRLMKWEPEFDEAGEVDEDDKSRSAPGQAHDGPDGNGFRREEGEKAQPSGDGATAGGSSRTTAVVQDGGKTTTTESPGTAPGGVPLGEKVRELPLFVAVTPVLLTLVLIAGGALADAMSVDSAALVFLTDPVVAILLGATLAYVLASRVRSRHEISGAISTALTQCGPILVLSGISGSLGFVIEGSGMAEILGSAFSSGFLPPLLLVWIVAAVLHIALGSITVAGITAAGILAPIAGSLDTPVVLVALAAGSGALFVPHVSSNFFWMFQSLLGFSTRGTIKTHTIPMTLASLISLPIVLAISAFQ